LSEDPRSNESSLPNDAVGAAAKGSWLNRTVLGISVATLFSDMGHEMATAAMPALLASLGASAALLGFIEGSADALSAFAKLLAGLYSDRLARRKPLAVVGYFATAAGMVSFAFATSVWQVAVGRIGGWLGRGMRTPVRNVLLTEATVPKTRGKAFGFERAMDSAGAVLGPLLAMAVLATLGMRSVFLLTVVPGTLAALCIAFLVREKPHAAQARAGIVRGFRETPRDFRRFLAAVFFAGLGDFSNTLLILWATQAWTPRYGMHQAATMAMGFYVAYNVIYTAACFGSGVLADRISKPTLLAIGYALAVIPALALLIPGASLLKFAAAFGFSGLYMGVWETVESATAAEYLPEHVRGVGFGLLATVNGVGDFVSSALVGLLWVVSPKMAMIYVIAMALVGAAIVARTRPVVPLR
jgi:MFS family permease